MAFLLLHIEVLRFYSNGMRIFKITISFITVQMIPPTIQAEIQNEVAPALAKTTRDSTVTPYSSCTSI